MAPHLVLPALFLAEIPSNLGISYILFIILMEFERQKEFNRGAPFYLKLESLQSVCWFSYASYILKSQQNENYNTNRNGCF